MREEISHELRTPLTVIKASLQHLLKKDDELPRTQRRELILQTLLEVDMLEGAIRRIEASAEEVDRAVDPEAVVLFEEEHSNGP